ncbi:Protein of unknown function [Gryllus bimaculatus]|nr:Protein of unknown function [Gryllus bimaculatus]
MECTLTSATNMLHSQIICHICCRVYERNKFTFVFDREGFDSKLPEKICKYTPFTVKSESHSSAVICTACVENLNSWDRYIQSCIEAHLALPEETEWKGEMAGESVEDLTVSQTIIHFSEPIQHSDNMKQMSEADMLDISSTVCKKKYCEKSRNTYCIAKWCSNNTGDNNISFFRVPKDRQRQV